MIYFDHNATSPLSPAARAAWLEATEKYIGNPASPHRLGSRADAALEEARATAGELLGCSAFDLVWTSGATEAANAIFHHAAQTAGGEVWISAIEHPCVMAAAARWFPRAAKLLPVTSDGVLDLEFFARELNSGSPSLVAVMAANNETGVLQPWREVSQLCRSRGVPFACDASQWLGKVPGAGLGGCDFVFACAHKFGGPAGVGLMKVPGGFRPLIVGGPQQDGRRAGTENVALALAMIAAWKEREGLIAQIPEREGWRDEFIAGLENVEVLGAKVPRLWNTVAALMPPATDCRRRFVVQLDKCGVAVSTGSACASGKEKPSHVLTAMGIDPSRADRMIRFSSSWETTREDWQKLLAATCEVCAIAS